jgi:hypothetical protein
MGIVRRVRMHELRMRPPDQRQTSEHESIDRRIAALRSSLEHESHDTDGGEPEWVQRSSRLLYRASLLMHARASEISFYGFTIAVGVVVGWLVGSKL